MNSVETLQERLHRERNARSKQRLHMLYLLKSGVATTRKEVSALLAVHRHTIGQWLARYEAAGLDQMLQIKTHPNRAYSLTPQMKVILHKVHEESIEKEARGTSILCSQR